MLQWVQSGEPEVAISRRERKKNQTHADLVAAATHLFAANGYEGTNIEQITELADVAPATFFLHFSAKEDVLFSDFSAEMLMAALEARPEGSNELEAIRDAYLEVLSYDEESLHRLLQHNRAIRSTSVLEGRYLAIQRVFQGHLALAVAGWRHLEAPDDSAKLVAVLGTAVICRAIERWVEADGHDDLEQTIRQEFEVALDTVISLAASSNHR